METVIRDLRAIRRIAMNQPILTLAAALVVVASIVVDTSNLGVLNGALYQPLGRSRPARSRVVADLRLSPAADGGLARSCCNREIASSDRLRIGAESFAARSSDKRDRHTLRRGDPAAAHRRIERKNASLQQANLAISFRIPSVSERREIHLVLPGEWTPTSLEMLRRQAVALTGTDLSKFIAGQAALDRRCKSRSTSDSATARRLNVEFRSEVDERKRDLPAASVVPVPAPTGWSYRSEGDAPAPH